MTRKSAGQKAARGEGSVATVEPIQVQPGVADFVPTVVPYPISGIAESPFQHRQNYGDLDELQRSIAQKGILQPLLARFKIDDKGRSYELVFGHRRLRAAALLGLETVPLMVRELSDEQVIEAQVIENVQRLDVSPVEEALGYRELINRCGLTPEDIAARTGKSRTTVYARLQLLQLDGDMMEAAVKGELSASVALLVASVPPGELRESFFFEVMESEAEPMSYRDARYLFDNQFRTALQEVAWKLDDAELVPAAGACSSCPKRSGAHPTLFGDAPSSRTDVCLDHVCFGNKREAFGARIRETHVAAGGEVVEVANAKKATNGSKSKWVPLDEVCAADDNGRTWKAILGKKAPPVVIVSDENGGVIQAFAREELKPALKAAKPELAKALERHEKALGRARSHSGGFDHEKWERERAREAVKRLHVRRTSEAMADEIGGEAAKAFTTGEAWIYRELVKLAVNDGQAVPGETLKELMTARGLEDKDASLGKKKKRGYGAEQKLQSERLDVLMENLSAPETLAFGVTLLLRMGGRYSDEVADFERWARNLGLQPAKVRANAKAKVAEIEKAEKVAALEAKGAERADEKAPAAKRGKKKARRVRS